MELSLYVQAVTPVGTFRGTLNSVPSAEEDLVRLRDELQNGIHRLYQLTIFNTDEHGDKQEITLPQNLISNSVFIFTIGAFEKEEE